MMTKAELIGVIMEILQFTELDDCSETEKITVINQLCKATLEEIKLD